MQSDFLVNRRGGYILIRVQRITVANSQPVLPVHGTQNRGSASLAKEEMPPLARKRWGKPILVNLGYAVGTPVNDHSFASLRLPLAEFS